MNKSCICHPAPALCVPFPPQRNQPQVPYGIEAFGRSEQIPKLHISVIMVGTGVMREVMIHCLQMNNFLPAWSCSSLHSNRLLELMERKEEYNDSFPTHFLLDPGRVAGEYKGGEPQVDGDCW